MRSMSQHVFSKHKINPSRLLQNNRNVVSLPLCFPTLVLCLALTTTSRLAFVAVFEHCVVHLSSTGFRQHRGRRSPSFLRLWHHPFGILNTRTFQTGRGRDAFFVVSRETRLLSLFSLPINVERIQSSGDELLLWCRTSCISQEKASRAFSDVSR